jgi:exosortase
MLNVTAPTRFLAISYLFLLSILFWWQPLKTTLSLALNDEAQTYILLVVPLSVGMIVLHWENCRENYHASVLSGSVVMISALFILKLTESSFPDAWHVTQISVKMSALVCWWLGSLILFFGVEVLESLLFPLGFLFLVVPLPEPILRQIVSFLQHQSANGARLLFLAIGTPVSQDDIVLSIPSLDIQVTEECSSIRSSVMLLIVSLVFAHLYLRRWWTKVVLVAIVIPLSIAKNAVRIFTIAELGTQVDPAYLTGRLHHNGGILFFAFAVGVLTLLLFFLQKIERGEHGRQICTNSRT